MKESPTLVWEFSAIHHDSVGIFKLWEKKQDLKFGKQYCHIVIRYKCMWQAAPKSWSEYTTGIWQAANKSWLEYTTFDKVEEVN